MSNKVIANPSTPQGNITKKFYRRNKAAILIHLMILGS